MKPFFSRSFFRKRFFKGFKESFTKETSHSICNKKMGTVLSKMEMLNKALDVLPATEEDIVLTGILKTNDKTFWYLRKPKNSRDRLDN